MDEYSIIRDQKELRLFIIEGKIMFSYFTRAVPKLIKWTFFVVDGVPLSTEIAKKNLVKFFYVSNIP